MKANELRIGNLVYLVDKEKICEILDGHEIDECDENPLVQPIPLTEEWLLKFGFDLYDGFSNMRFINIVKHEYDSSTISFSHTEQLTRFSNGHPKGSTLIPHIKYVHQLQNLYFALTGEELTQGGEQ